MHHRRGRAVATAAPELAVLERDTAPLASVTSRRSRGWTTARPWRCCRRQGQRHRVGRRPGRRGRDRPVQPLRQAPVPDQLPQEGQGLLHEGEPGQPAHRSCAPTCWPPRATGRSSAAASARTTWKSCWPASARRSCRRRPTAGTSTCASSALRPLRLRPGPGAHGHLDLRHATHPRGDPVPADAVQVVAIVETVGDGRGR